MSQLRQHIEEITPITDQEFNYIRSFFTTRKIKKHQYLLQVGERISSEYWIAKGTFRAFFYDPEGKEHIVQFAIDNGWLSDYSFYINKPSTSHLNIVCMEDAEIYCLTLDAKEKLASDLHKMEHFFRIKLNKTYLAQQRRIMSLLSHCPKKKYEEFANLYPAILQRIPKKYIAEYLGLSRETLSRLYTASMR